MTANEAAIRKAYQVAEDTDVSATPSMSSNSTACCCSRTSRGFTLAIHGSSPYSQSDRRGATVFVHPNPSPDPVAHRLGLPDSLIDFTADTTRAVAEMLYSNRFARASNVNVLGATALKLFPRLADGSA